MRKVRIESCTLCKLRCPGCPSHIRTVDNCMGKGWLTADHFRRFLRLSPSVKQIELVQFGELFLNPEMLDIARIAKAANVILLARGGTTLNGASADTLREIIRTGAFHDIRVAIDGASAETYPQYRVGGDFDEVIRNLDAIVDEKKIMGSAIPSLQWQFVVFGHNEHEIGKAKAMAGARGMSFFAKMNCRPSVSPIRDRQKVMEECGWQAADRAGYKAKTKKRYMGMPCAQAFSEIQINYDGRALGCCLNYWKPISGINAFDAGIDAVDNDPDVITTRRIVTGQEPAPEDHACARCSVYRDMKAGGEWYNPEA